MSENSWLEPEVFSSLSACVAFANSLEPRGAFLFRGESTDSYSTTPSMHARLDVDKTLPTEKCRTTVKDCVEWLHRDLQRFLGLPSDLALGFLQHYEAPTRMLDLTASAEVAAYFAANGEAGSHGLFAILPKAIARYGSLVDLTDHPKANRPRRQHAFTFQSPSVTNLKDPSFVRNAGIRWFRFKHSQAETDNWLENGDNHELMDASSDEVAGVVQLLLDSYGKINDRAAEWLANHVVAAPFITRLIAGSESGGGIVELVSAKAAELGFDSTIERFNNHRIWSNAFRDTRGQGGFQNLVAIKLPGK